MNKFIITIEQTGVRIDKLIPEVMPEITRSKAQKLIKEGLVKINKKCVSAHYKVKKEEILEISTELKKKEKEEIKKAIKKAFIKPQIVEINDEYIIINKPAGLIVHGAEHIEDITLADYLVKKFPEIKKVGDDSIRPGIVHRLDREASGLLVVARTQESFNNLKKQFQKRKIKKVYRALVHDNIEKEYDTINFPIKRSTGGYRMAAHPLLKKGEPNKIGRKALTYYEVEKHFINYALLKVRIETGRTHQIRVHMSAIGHPIVGDNVYGTRKNKEKNEKLKMERIFLVAEELEFTDLHGQKKNYKINLPVELKDLLKKIK